MVLSSMPRGSAAQARPGFFLGEESISSLIVSVDLDDDDDDGIPDATQEIPPPSDARRLHLSGRGPAMLRAEGALRVLWAGRPLPLPARITLPADVRIQGTGAGAGALVLAQGNATARLRTTHVAIQFIDAAGALLTPTRHALYPSYAIPNDQGLPRGDAPSAGDERAFYVRVSGLDGASVLHLRSLDGTQRSVRSAPLSVVDGVGRGPWMRLVSDALEESAPTASSQLLAARLGDRIEASIEGATQSLRVGRPIVEQSSHAIREIDLAITVLSPGGSPVIGSTPDGAQRLAALQAQSVADAWSPCLLRVRHRARLSAPPPPALLAVADGDGLPARGGGEFRFRAGQRSIAVRSVAGESPLESAERIALAIRAGGMAAEVRPVPATTFGAGPSADIIVRDEQSFLVSLSADGDAPLSGDARQSLRIGHVDLRDGVDAFDNHRPGGTLEERALVSLLRDDDPRTLDIFIIDAFAGAARQGEAFIPSDRGPAAGAVIIDRRGAAYARTAWTMAHEVGHLLLNNPFHPDNFGPDTPRRLMDSNRRDGSILGPRRITPEECALVRSATTPYVHN